LHNKNYNPDWIQYLFILGCWFTNWGRNKATHSTFADSRCAPRLLPLYRKDIYCRTIGKKIRSRTIRRLALGGSFSNLWIIWAKSSSLKGYGRGRQRFRNKAFQCS
jgi:hypothetical protein